MTLFLWQLEGTKPSVSPTSFQPHPSEYERPIRIINLGSGSRGNSTLICHDSKILMVDCGFSHRQTVLRMTSLGLNPGAVCGILLTHEHGDHIKGAHWVRRDSHPCFS